MFYKHLLFYHAFTLHRPESRTRPILTPYDGRRQWDSNLRTPACESPARSTTVLQTPGRWEILLIQVTGAKIILSHFEGI